MNQPPEGGCCRCIASFTITSGFAALFIWLSLKTHDPTCSIEQFYVFALNATTNPANNNHTISYNLKLNNKNNDKGIYYTTLNLKFYYKPNVTSYYIGNGSYSGFYQGHGKDTHRVGNVGLGVKWEKQAVEAVSRNEEVVFRVELVTEVRFKIVFWKTRRRRRLDVSADLVVDDHGSLVRKKKKKGIKLVKSSGWKIEICIIKLFIVLISVVSLDCFSLV